MPQVFQKNLRSLQVGGIGIFLLGTIFAVFFLFLLFGPGGTKVTSQNSVQDPISVFVNTPPSPLVPVGELAEIFTLGSDHTDLQRQLKLKEILGKIVQWQLPVYDVKQSGSGYVIQTSTSLKGDSFRKKVVGTFIHITPQDESDRRLVESLKTGSLVTFKGIIEDTLVRNLVIKPAILVKESNLPALSAPTQPSNLAATSAPTISNETPDASTPEAIADNFAVGAFDDLRSILSDKSFHCPTPSECKAGDYSLLSIDVNADGKNEFIVTHSLACGSGGCSTYLMTESTDKTWETLSSTFGSIQVLPSTTNGYRDIQHIQKIYPKNGPWYLAAQKFSWTGRGYSAIGKLESLPP